MIPTFKLVEEEIGDDVGRLALPLPTRGKVISTGRTKPTLGEPFGALPLFSILRTIVPYK